ncbi:MAG: hypothetical protein ACOVO2_22105 [Emticicia sp.]|uniref:hypothetical protein n=1 Tax=Emticicia sp. TaxID=1930953 RepID=UPI003BA54F02
MNINQKKALENKTEIKEETKLDYKRLLGWGFGLLIGLMAIAYFAGFITFGTPEQATDADKKAYFEKDSIATANVATMDSTKK